MEHNIIKSGEWGNCIWGIDDAGFLVIGSGFATSLETEPAPWDSVRDQIKEVSVDGTIALSRGASLAGMFKDCVNLTKVKLKGLDTSEVIDMTSMFENCSELGTLDLSSFNTEKVLDMGRMFSGCRNLASLDLSSFNTHKVRNMRNMFSRCNSLMALCLGYEFSTNGDGSTDCGNMLIRDTGKYRMAKVLSVKGGIVTYHENRGRQLKTSRETLSDYQYFIEDVQFEKPGYDYKFLGWNDESDGSGRTYLPGDELSSVDNDLDLYAMWGRPPKVGMLEAIPEIQYGQPLPIETPEIISQDDSSIYGYLEISPTGEEGSFTPIDRKAILPVSYSGYLVRLCVSNKSGTTVSNAVPITINKSGIDLSKVRWAETTNMTYDGTPKKVWLEGLPEGVSAVYGNNVATEAGVYSTSVELDYDRENFDIPVRIKNYEWRIKKARYDMSEVRWDYMDEFTFDGTEKSINLTGLPEGVTANYAGNVAVNAGVMTATATFNYDNVNYEEPDSIPACTWKINKTILDTREFTWTSYDEFTYDGYTKSVRITNLPEDAEVEYFGADETQAGNYLARAILRGNYTNNQQIEYEWEIKKANYNMSEVKWNYTAPFTYDKESHAVHLVGLPNGLSARYRNYIGTDVGDYIATATFISLDSHNYVIPADMNIRWSIKKAVADMSQVHWNYSEPFEYDGTTKSVELMGLPLGVYALIENGSGSATGVYNAHANMKYDERNYEVMQPADCQWQITKARYDMSEVKWNYEEAFDYDGTAKEIKLLNVPEGITVEYFNNNKIESGKYVATAKLLPIDPVNYEIPEINGCAWSIKKAALDRMELEWTDYSEFVYDGKEKSVQIISDISDNIRVEYSGSSAINAGDHEAVATFLPTDVDNFEAPEPLTYKWTIKKGDFELSNVVWDYNSAFTYDGSRKTVSLVDIPKGVTVHYEGNSATTVGTYVATAHFEVQDPDNYNEIEPIELRWSIKKGTIDMSNVSWQSETEFTYDGNEKSVTLKNIPDGIVPVYEGSTATNAGEYVVSVDFKYDETNYEKPSFPPCRWQIDKAVIDVSRVDWDYEEAFTYDGMEKNVRLVNLPDGVIVNYDNASATNAGLYYASAEIVPLNDENYLPATVHELAWRIDKGEYIMTDVFWDYDTPFVYDGFEKRIVLRGLPDGITATYDGNYGIEAGIYVANARLILDDGFNYNAPRVDSCRWIIERADVDMSNVEWDYRSKFTYDGRMHEITLQGVPKGVRALYSGNCETNAGVYTARAEFVLFDNENYNVPAVMDCNWEIVKADYDMSDVRWRYDAVRIYNSREQSVFLENLPNGIVASYLNNEAKNVGRYVASATLVNGDTLNYNSPSVDDCVWEIAPAAIDMAGVYWNYIPHSLVYDGTEKSIELANIPDGVDVKYSGVKAVGAGIYHAVAEFISKSNYHTPETMECEWSIDKADCDLSQVRWDYTHEFTYDGNVHGIEVTGLPAHVTAHYDDNKATDAGEYLAIARFTTDAENYNIPEDMSCPWVINKANCDISGITWDYAQAFVYDGNAKLVTLTGVPSNLSVNYYGNVATTAGQYNAQAEFVAFDPHNYNVPESMSIAWEIKKADYDMTQTRWIPDRTFVYDGRNKSIELEGCPSDLRPIYVNNSMVSVGQYTASVTFEFDYENYNEPTFSDCTWEIKKSSYDMSGVFWSYTDSFVYDGRTKSVELMNLPYGLSPIYNHNTGEDAGTYYASVTFAYDELNYEEPSFEGCTWVIEPADIPVRVDDLVWTYDEPFIYDGQSHRIELATGTRRADHIEAGALFSRLFSRKKEVEPEPVEEVAPRYIGIPEGFEVSFEGNEATNAGSYIARAIIRPLDVNNYKSCVISELRWDIRKATLDMSNVRWNYNHHIIYDGSEKFVELVGVPEELTVQYITNSAVAAGRYEANAALELKDEINYNKPHPIKGCIWEIERATYDMSKVKWEYDDNFVYDGGEKTVKLTGLPSGVQIENYYGNKATDAGSYTAEAILSYQNADNYNTPFAEPLRWRIQKNRIDTDNIRWTYNDDTNLVYDDQVKSVTLTGVPSGVDVIYVNNNKVGAGTYIAKAKLIYDSKNYSAEDIPDCVWKIEKASFNTTNARWTYDKPFVYNGEVRKVYLENMPSTINVRYMDNRASEPGAYTAKAYLTYNRDNYNEPDVETTLEWSIIRPEDHASNK